MPALPLAARTLGHGVISLLVALAAAAAVAYAAHVYLTPTQGANADIWGATVGIIVIYAVAIIDKTFGFGLMSLLTFGSAAQRRGRGHGQAG